jgi:hypothetical protein
MSGYAKLFSDIVESSIWDEPSDICKVWITLLALADSDGYVRGSPGWLAGKSRVSIDACKSAIGKFQKPDHKSRTPDHEGRRIEQLDDGWLILNYLLFRDRLSSDPKASATRERVRRHRQRYRALRNTESVTPDDSASEDASEDASEKKKTKQGENIPPSPKEVSAYSKEIGYPVNGEAWCDTYAQKGWMVGKNKMKNWKAALRNWKRSGYRIGNNAPAKPKYTTIAELREMKGEVPGEPF